MESALPAFQKHVFICENRREGGRSCCAERGSEALREALKKAVKDGGLASRVRVSRSGCLDVCEQGPNVLLMPDNIWFKNVAASDIPALMDAVRKGL